MKTKISDELNCKFIRFNPHEDNIGDIINIIFCYIFDKEIPKKEDNITKKLLKKENVPNMIGMI